MKNQIGFTAILIILASCGTSVQNNENIHLRCNHRFNAISLQQFHTTGRIKENQPSITGNMETDLRYHDRKK